ncbi:uncharacterized protein [Paramisgurnus dabryanus]|uniref:uncharacterized protein isoform X2 n=1 Tax=Paramisgurnus dabryanus TaxID=90735 RepID=UPI003CCF8E8A
MTQQFHVNSNTQNPGMKHCHEHAKPTDGDIFLNPEKPLQSRLAMNKEKMRELTSQMYVVQVIGTVVSQHHLLACTSRMRSIQMRFSPMPANRQWKTRASTSPTTLPQAFEIPTYNCFSPLCWDHWGLHRPACTRYIRCEQHQSAAVRDPKEGLHMFSRDSTPYISYDEDICFRTAFPILTRTFKQLCELQSGSCLCQMT